MVDRERRFMGWCDKRGVKNPAWKRRWLVLTYDQTFGTRVHYFKSPDDAKAKGIIETDDDTEIEYPAGDESEPHCFNILTPDRTWHLKARSESEVERWVAAIEEALKNGEGLMAQKRRGFRR